MSGLANSGPHLEPVGFLGLKKLDFLATPRTEVNLARKLGAEATAFWENADTNRSALTPIKKYSEGTLKLLATNLNSCSRRSFHNLIRAECEPLLVSVFLDAPIAFPVSGFEFADVS